MRGDPQGAAQEGAPGDSDVWSHSVQVPAGSLVEPARQRLLAVAADVLGLLAAEDVPGALRPVARFTAARRVRLGASALSAALDADSEFRDRVAEVVAQASPTLAEAVLAGDPTTASDPIDVAVVAFLLRPDGWAAIVDAAGARWAAERDVAVDGARRDELEALRAEVTQLRATRRTEPVRVRTAVAEATKALADDAAQLRARLRARSAELRAAERELAQARERAAAADERLAAADGGRDAESRRLKGRIAELERGLGTGRRAVRTTREVDDARLWLLVDTLTEAAAGVRRELSLSAPTSRPADFVAGDDAARGSAATRRYVDDAAVFDRLLELPHAHLIVDGYNVTKSGYGELPLVDQRKRLVTSLASVAGRAAVEVTVVFDGGTRPPALPPVPRGVRVLFSTGEEIADDLIRRLVGAEPDGRPLVVVSSDQQVQRDVHRAGAWVVPSSVLLRRVAQV